MKIGTITTGQSPRIDIILELKEAIGFEVEIVERGVFDNLTRKEIINLDYRQDDYTMVVRMRDGEQIKVAERHIIEGVKKCIADLERIEVDLIILLCTGKFPKEITSNKLFLKPNKLIENIVESMPQDGVMAVIVPLLEQIPLIEQKWKITNPNQKAIFDAVSPYTGTDDEIKKVAERIAKTDANLVILDCVGYNKRVKTVFQKVTKKPILLPSTLLGRIAGELICGGFNKY